MRLARATLVIARLLLLVLALALTNQACHRKAPTNAKSEEREPTKNEANESSKRSSSRERTPAREVYASWYDVPIASLAKRRAGFEEFTAAHNRLPLGTLVRVTHLGNGKSVKVRITDRGITNRKIKLDVCKEAALELDMVAEGIARVRMQVVREEEDAATPGLHTSASQQ